MVDLPGKRLRWRDAHRQLLGHTPNRMKRSLSLCIQPGMGLAQILIGLDRTAYCSLVSRMGRLQYSISPVLQSGVLSNGTADQPLNALVVVQSFRSRV